jgi:hypothetical protein
MKTYLFGLLFLVFVGSFIQVNDSRADELIQISGTVLMVGNNSANCTPSPCSVVVDFTMQLDLTPIPDNNLFVQVIPNGENFKVSSSLGQPSGPLSAFEEYLANTQSSYFGFIVMPGFPGEVDLDFAIQYTPAGYVFQADGVQLFSCLSTSCVQDFIFPQDQQAFSGGCFNLSCEAVASPVELVRFSAAPVSESSALSIAVCGLICLALSVFAHRVSSGMPRSTFQRSGNS